MRASRHSRWLASQIFVSPLPSLFLLRRLFFRNGYAPPAAMGVAAKRAHRLQERRSCRLPCSRLKRLTVLQLPKRSTPLQSPRLIDCSAVKGTEGELSCPREAVVAHRARL